MSKYHELLQKCEADVRAGQAQQVAKRLNGVNFTQVPRELRLPLANVARRASLFAQGMRLLAPLIHPEQNKWRSDATPRELAEYAVLLQKLGVLKEALQTLARVDRRVVPEAFLYEAFCYFSLWNYPAALGCLERYLATDLSKYQSLVGRVNLAAALIGTERLSEACTLLDENITLAESGGHQRLEGNCLELRAQVHLQQGSFAAALADLERAALIFSGERTIDQLFVRKWQAVIEGLTSGSPDPIIRFRCEAEERHHWESVREADLNLLKVKFEHEHFLKLYVGTPYASYRRRIERELGRVPEQDAYRFGHGEGKALDLRSGKIANENSLNPGKKIHQLLEILSRDLYRPVRLGGLFTELFPGENFDIFSSPGRVHQLLRRTRRWLEATKTPLEIHEAGGDYRLKLNGGFALILPVEREAIEGPRFLFAQLCRLYSPDEEFTAREARARLDLPLTSFNRLITWALEEKLVERIGGGAHTRYQLIGRSSLKQAA